MNNLQKTITATLLASSLFLGACQTQPSKGYNKDDMAVLDKSNVLDLHRANVEKSEARLVIMGSGDALTNEESDNLVRFVKDYVKLGHSNISISYPQYTANASQYSGLLREIQKQLYVAGVDYSKIDFKSYEVNGSAAQPITLSFTRYIADEVKCKSWTELNPQKTASNLPTENFGCANNANIAAMIVDPGDLIGVREDAPTSATREQVGVELYKTGKIPAVSATTSGGSK